VILLKRAGTAPVLAVALTLTAAAPIVTVPRIGAPPSPLQICLEAAADSSPVYPTAVLPATNTDAAAVFELSAFEKFRTLDFAWIALDVGEAAPRHYEIAKGSLALRGRHAGVLRLSGLKNPLPPGQYELDVWADKAPWHSQTFAVQTSAAAVPLDKPSDLIPLAVGKTWKYGFVQEAGPGAKVSLPGIAPGPDGKLHAEVTMSAAQAEADAVRIETRRNNTLVFEEWWRLDQSGLFATKRRQTGGEIQTLTPPQKLLSFPPRPQSWNYQAADRSFRQTYRMWGPLTVRAPAGAVAGFVVFTEQTSGPTTMTAERHFVPGIGLVREILITALGGDMISRQEIQLQ